MSASGTALSPLLLCIAGGPGAPFPSVSCFVLNNFRYVTTVHCSLNLPLTGSFCSGAETLVCIFCTMFIFWILGHVDIGCLSYVPSSLIIFVNSLYSFVRLR
ncbi:hypothetical protein C8J56DRAFT_936286 [Mycena floridula]|nr:hypothetical protein C8J56DRAFT_936286 [Mycena floridula]